MFGRTGEILGGIGDPFIASKQRMYSQLLVRKGRAVLAVSQDTYHKKLLQEVRVVEQSLGARIHRRRGTEIGTLIVKTDANTGAISATFNDAEMPSDKESSLTLRPFEMEHGANENAVYKGLEIKLSKRSQLDENVSHFGPVLEVTSTQVQRWDGGSVRKNDRGPTVAVPEALQNTDRFYANFAINLTKEGRRNLYRGLRQADALLTLVRKVQHYAGEEVIIAPRIACDLRRTYSAEAYLHNRF